MGGTDGGGRGEEGCEEGGKRKMVQREKNERNQMKAANYQ